MELLQATATDDDLFAFVRDWIIKLAHHDYIGAFDMTGHLLRTPWSPDLIREVIAGYGLPGPSRSGHNCRVTLPDLAIGRPRVRQFDQFSDPICLGEGAEYIGDVLHDIPLDGQWSDLTVRFQVERRTDQLMLVLAEIHVF